jgi:hypothetical protein
MSKWWFIVILATTLVAERTQAAPRVRKSPNNNWQLDVTFQDPQRLTLDAPGETGPFSVWYLLYEVTNRTRADREFFPSFRLVTDTLEVIEGGANVNPVVYDLIAQRHRDEYPFLAPPTAVTGLLLQGEANARASVAVFRDFDPKAHRFTIFGGGFSGIVERVPNPAFRLSESESDANARYFMVRRTLAVTYDLPGDPGTRHLAVPVRRSREWVMR